jgi:hypothetical protein
VIWLTPIDHNVAIPSPTTSDTVVITPLIKGLELHLTAGTTIVGDDGKTATQLSITAIPLKQPPFPLPDVNVVSILRFSQAPTLPKFRSSTVN